MAMDAGEIERLIRAKFPDAQVEIRDLAGDGDHYAAHVVGSRVQGQVPRPAAPDGVRSAGRPHGRRAACSGADHRSAACLRHLEGAWRPIDFPAPIHTLPLGTRGHTARRRTSISTSIPMGPEMSNPQQDVQDWIRTTVGSNDVVLFMKGNKNMPQCGFSAQVDHILRALGVDFKDINVLQDMAIRDGIKAYSNWPTVPQLYVKGEFVGGCDIVREMLEAGELTAMFDEKGVAYDKTKLTA